MPSRVGAASDLSPLFTVERHLDEYMALLAELDPRAVEQLARVFLGAWPTRRTIFCCGNGGSAMSACHLATDLTKLTAPARGHRLRAQALTDSVATVSAIANDFAYEEVFVEQLKSFLEPGDVLVPPPYKWVLAERAARRGVRQPGGWRDDVDHGTPGCRAGRALAARARRQLRQCPADRRRHHVVGHLACMRTKDLVARESLELAYKEKPAMLHVVRAEDRPAV